jgi:hypothetical protein
VVGSVIELVGPPEGHVWKYWSSDGHRLAIDVYLPRGSHQGIVGTWQEEL